jgi:hypothetical protein
MDFNNTRRGNFLGHDGFGWWVGVIENRMDPLNLGRCQVRIKGLHTEQKETLETSSLPWSQILFPVNSSFTTPTTVKEGDMVIGFFMDGDAAQFPIIFGTFHGIPEESAKSNQGFNDPRTEKQLKSSPRKPKKIEYKTDGSGAAITEASTASSYPNRLDEPTTSRLARNETISETIIATKKSSVAKAKTAGGGSWTEPETKYDTKYPYNQVTSTESGHYFELDDTPGAERIHLYHRSGTFTETHPDGSQVDKVVKDKYSIVMKDDHVYVMGDCSVTVQGNAKVYVQKDCNLQVDGDLDFNVKGDWNASVSGDWNTKISGTSTHTTGGTAKHTSGGDTIIKGSNIRLN